MGYVRYVSLTATLSSTIAVAIDLTLPAFHEIKDTFGLPRESSFRCLDHLAALAGYHRGAGL